MDEEIVDVLEALPENYVFDDKQMWKGYGNQGKRLFTAMPQPVMGELICGDLSANEMKLLLYICRLSFGVCNRKKTNYLGQDDFSRVTKIHPSSVSRGLGSLLKKGIILTHENEGKRRRYSVNLSKYQPKSKKA